MPARSRGQTRKPIVIDTERAGSRITHSPSGALLEIPYLEEDSDAPPIPIPAPPNQTSREQPADTNDEFDFDDNPARRPTVGHIHTVAPSLAELTHHAHNPFSYGYAHGPSPSSGLARTIRAAVPPVRATMSPAKRPAVPVVDLGNAAVGSRVEHRVGGSNLGEEVLWARWDAVSCRLPRTTRLLFVCYPCTLRIWDTTDLENVGEVLRLPLDDALEEESDVRLVHAAVLPCPAATQAENRPWIGLAFTSGTFAIYSLKLDRVVSRFTVARGGARIESFEANEDVIVLSTTNPPTLRVFSATTFTLLVEIPGERLELYVLPSPGVGGVGMGGQTPASVKAKAMLSSAFGSALGSLGQQQHQQERGYYGNGNGNDNRTRSRNDTMTANFLHADDDNECAGSQDPKPVYALSRRLLAYASSVAAGSASHSPQSARLASASVQPPAVAQSVWEGVRTLGGLAVSVARRGAGDVMGGVGGVGKFFSRSAPERSATARARSDSASAGGRGMGDADADDSVHVSGEGGYVTVVDLKPLLGGVREADVVAEFKVDKERGLSRLVFSPDGCSIGAVARDGTGVRVYQVRPRDSESAAWNVYHLRRGRTGAVVDALQWSSDGRWVAMGTRKRTVHLFAVNPYGGKIDTRSHWEGKVRNVDQLQPMPVDMGPLVRLRAGAPIQRVHAPLAFIFVEPGEVIPKHLLPVPSSSPPQAHPRSYSSHHTDAAASPPHSPHTLSNKRPTNFQDVLVFDPADVSLALRRVMLEMCPREQGIGIGMGISLGALGAGVTSISLPGMGFAGPGAGSPSSSAGSAVFRQRGSYQWQQGQEVQMELGARESTVMTWSLGGWAAGDIRRIVGVERGEGQAKGGRADWLAQAELSTHSKSSKILPRSIYLSHQFSFYTLGEDYHALIRRYQLDIGGLKMDVRREVQVSAYAADAGESFVEGFAAPRDMRHHRTLSASFDEPLASALANELEHSRVTSVLPMLPNGTPGSRPQSFRNAIPIRTFGDGMSESFGRLRREISRVRSPHVRPATTGGAGSVISASVPLEFDEEDEDFVRPELLHDVRGATSSRETSRGHGDAGCESTPATSEDDWDRKMETKEDAWGGWSEDDRRAVEEVERFDDVDVLGLLDEEQQQARMAVVERRFGSVERGDLKRRGRGRRG